MSSSTLRLPRRRWRLLLPGAIALTALLASAGLWSLMLLMPAGADRLPPVADSEQPAAAPEAPLAKLDRQAEADFISYVQPTDALLYEMAASRLSPGASPSELAREADRLAADWAEGAYHGPSPAARANLQVRQEQLVQALGRGLTPAEAFALPELGEAPVGSRIAGLDGGENESGNAPAQDPAQLLRLFVVAVEFAGEDEVADYPHPVSMTDRNCITDTLTTYSGPLHNEIKEPSPEDNETFWLDNFDHDFYDKLIFSEEGIDERPRMDMVDPEDGQPGIDFSGLTMRNFFGEVSGGKVRFDGGPAGIQAWVQVPHSVAWYAASRCTDGEAPRVQAMNGLPGNPRFPSGVSSLVADAADAINAADPDFPWSDYDMDGNGEVDHVVLIHAGLDKSDGGGVNTYEQIWAHRASLDGRNGGYTVDDGGTPEDRSDDVRIRGYTMQPENLYLGVLVHEFGHDIGLPDLYDTGGAGRNTVAWWELMSLGARTGRLNGSDPTHLGAWSKMAMEWSAPRVITPTEDAEDFIIGQNSSPPPGTDPSLMIEIPPSVIPDIRLQAGSTEVWHSGADQGWADAGLLRDLDLSALAPGTPVTLSFDMAYQTENNWDFGFVEVSADAGQSYTQTKGFRADTGEELTTPGDYPDTNGALAGYGGLKYGYTGSSGGWLRARHDLSAWAGQNIRLRLRYATDAGSLGYGFYLDNFRIEAGGDLLFEDPVEGGDQRGWRSEPGSFRTTTGAGWRLSDAARRYARYYLLEWRSTAGFDKGLKYAYNTIYSRQTPDGRRELKVDHLPTNAPGLLVWVWDTRFGSNNNTLTDSRFRSLPSEGAKGGVMVLDSHPVPLRGPLGGKVANAFGDFAFPPEDNWDGRVQTSDSAFNFAATPVITLTAAAYGNEPARTVMTPTVQGGRPAQAAFHDAFGWSPGIELLPEPITVFSDNLRSRIKRYAFSDPDGGLVVPAAGYHAPRTPAGFTGLGAESSPPSIDVGSDETLFVDRNGDIHTVDVGDIDAQEVQGQHSGNPGDEGLHFGFHFEVVDAAEDGSSGTVRIWRTPWAAEVSAEAALEGADIAIQSRLQNLGGAGPLLFYSDFDEESVLPGDDKLPMGAVYVSAAPHDLLGKLRAGGPDVLARMAVDPADATAIAWLDYVATGADAALAYRLRPRSGASELRLRSLVYALEGGNSALAVHDLQMALGSKLYLPALWNKTDTR